MSTPPPEMLVVDACVLINFLHIDRMDLLRDLPVKLLVTDHVEGEINIYDEEQKMRLQAALDAGCCEMCSVKGDKALKMFGQLSDTGRLGEGESATIAHALSIGAGVATDDKRAAREARRIDGQLVIVGTEDLMRWMICEGLLSVSEADEIKDEWEAEHCFKMEIGSFGE